MPDITKVQENRNNYKYEPNPTLRNKFSKMSFFHSVRQGNAKEVINRGLNIVNSGYLYSLAEQMKSVEEGGLGGTLEIDLDLDRHEFIYFCLGTTLKPNAKFSLTFEIPHQNVASILYDDLFFCNDLICYKNTIQSDLTAYSKTILTGQDGIEILADCVGEAFPEPKKYITSNIQKKLFDDAIFNPEFAVRKQLPINSNVVKIHAVGMDPALINLMQAAIIANNGEQQLCTYDSPQDFINYLIHSSQL